MSENLSNELPVITNINELPETAVEELTNGQEVEKPAKNTSTAKKSAKKSEEVAKDE